MNWNIIEYSEEYRDKVINLWIEICVKEFNFDDWHDDIRKMDNHTYKEDNGNFWIAINDKDEVIGTIALKNIENGKGCLKSLYVKKEERRNGIAKELFNRFMEFAILSGYKTIELDTYQSFEHAIRFYEKNNFILREKIDDKYIMERNI